LLHEIEVFVLYEIDYDVSDFLYRFVLFVYEKCSKVYIILLFRLKTKQLTRRTRRARFKISFDALLGGTVYF
jgi:hypothetical protein